MSDVFCMKHLKFCMKSFLASAQSLTYFLIVFIYPSILQTAHPLGNKYPETTVSWATCIMSKHHLQYISIHHSFCDGNYILLHCWNKLANSLSC